MFSGSIECRLCISANDSDSDSSSNGDSDSDSINSDISKNNKMSQITKGLMKQDGATGQDRSFTGLARLIGSFVLCACPDCRCLPLLARPPPLCCYCFLSKRISFAY